MLYINTGNLIGQPFLTSQGFINQRQLICEVPFLFYSFLSTTHFKEKQFHSQQTVRLISVYFIFS
ncbi:hypothetical protein GCM10011573_23940 [Enterococcus wangshanyuanii]|uniref:Uncharacterized protein n=1 Tax=Enterococcus wangshanyuanii TaxID=2005703 RepID=A0ABQ1P9H5_9ENTE|nr:hypothetical protein GCM10011573_23940 [Enterococcus wangshanyuanii]